ncbi:MAG: hypothetical protein OEY65_08850 [Gammaproteobacteria bacterium]|nr:hypothetical protein [Gammaproteobacteria bacterium]
MDYRIHFIILCLFASPLCANENPTAEELEKWFLEDTLTTKKEVNEGQLIFLKTPPMKPTLHSINVFTIDDTSINEGWVKLSQCYENLDSVPVAEVVFQYHFMRHLKIKSSRNIQQAKVKNQSVQLEDIKKNARLCITAEVRNFYQNEDKSFSLVNGPYHRKFLDGYYPYHLSMDIKFSKQLKFVNQSPKNQIGYTVKKSPNRLNIDTWFEGKLNTEFRFRLIK